MPYNIIISLTRQLHNSSRVHFFSYRELRFSDTSFPSNSHMLKLVWKEPSDTNNITVIWDRICSNNKSLSEKFTVLSTGRDFCRAIKMPFVPQRFPQFIPSKMIILLGMGSSTACSSQWTPKIMQSSTHTFNIFQNCE